MKKFKGFPASIVTGKNAKKLIDSINYPIYDSEKDKFLKMCDEKYQRLKGGTMTKDQEKHLERIKNKFVESVDSKYRSGQVQHGGNLWELGLEELLENALDEAIDQAVYIMTILEKIKGTKTERIK